MIETTILTFDQWLRQMLEAKGMSQAELAARSGLTRSVINAYVRGKIGLPSADNRRAIAGVLGVRHIDILIAAGEIAHDEVYGPDRPYRLPSGPERPHNI